MTRKYDKCFFLSCTSIQLEPNDAASFAGERVRGRAGVPEGYLSPEGLSAGVSLGGEVSREEGGRSKL